MELNIVIPNDYKIVNSYPSSDNVKIVRYGKQTDTYSRLWEQISLKKYAKKSKMPLLCTGNISPIYKTSYMVLHDATIHEKNEFKQSFWFRLKHNIFDRIFLYKCKQLFTVSDYSKDRIVHFFPKLKTMHKEPIVLCNGYEHLFEIKEEKIENLQDEFYFAVGSLNTNKNFKYIIELAKHNPNKRFVIAGGAVEKWSKKELEAEKLLNCDFVGYVSDEQLKWLYSHCKGFILPSLYEGFGIPPLEALACGCENIYLSNIEVFREIYSGVATFFNPKDYVNTVKLDDCNIKQEDIERVLNKYTWDNAADIIYKKIKEDFEN